MKAVLFDLDGTLIDTVSLYEEASRHALSLAGHTLTGGQFHELYGRDACLGVWLDALGIGRELEAVIRANRHEMYKQLLHQRAEWISQTEEALLLLQPQFHLGIVTGARREYLEIVETKLRLRRYMRVIITDEDVGGLRKPHPQGLLMASAALNVQPDECAYVGDQLYDLEAADAAGMRGYICSSPTTAAALPEQYRGKIVASILDVERILRGG
jgi:HAD superfamily hydrolase (TIGR01509 family)